MTAWLAWKLSALPLSAGGVTHVRLQNVPGAPAHRRRQDKLITDYNTELLLVAPKGVLYRENNCVRASSFGNAGDYAGGAIQRQAVRKSGGEELHGTLARCRNPA
jgi:hypothetical protein